MKKGLLISLFVVLAILIFGIFNFSEYIPEIPSRLAKYHNTIKVSVADNGKLLDVENIKLSYKGDNDSLIDTKAIKNGKVKFKKGVYGFNTFDFTIPNKITDEIDVEFGQFNTNWWHVCAYDVNVEISTVDEKSVEVVLKVDVTVEGYIKSYEETKILTKENNNIQSV